MARRREASAPEWARLYEMAEPQQGYVTTAQARQAGYSNPLLHYHVRQARLERVARGIYRLVHFPAGDHEDLVVVWLWSNQQGVFSHETALALHELSDALPNVKHLSVPSTWKKRRLRAPRRTQLYYADVEPRQRSWVGPVPVTNSLRTVIDCAREGVDPGLVEQAILQGLSRGLFGEEELREGLTDAGRRDLFPLTRHRGRRRTRSAQSTRR